VTLVAGVDHPAADCAIVVALFTKSFGIPALDAAVAAARALDAAATSAGGLYAAGTGIAGGRLILAPTGPLTHDTADVRAFADAAAAAVARAMAAGCKAPVLLVSSEGITVQSDYFAHATQVAVSPWSLQWRHLVSFL
jgi:leucyl aminopeptidase